MKRMGCLILGDIRFQNKYGFHALYIFFTLVYIGILQVLPDDWHRDASAWVIFSDPAMLGLIFIGAMVLFEKSERVLHSLAVSPVRTWEYVLSKTVSLGIISTFCGCLIAWFGGAAPIHGLAFTAGLFLGACLFTCIGLIISTCISSLNQFVVSIVPAQLLIVLPVIVFQYGCSHPLWLLHPGCAVFELISATNGWGAWAVCSLVVWLGISFGLAVKKVGVSMKQLGGARL